MLEVGGSPSSGGAHPCHERVVVALDALLGLLEIVLEPSLREEVVETAQGRERSRRIGLPDLGDRVPVRVQGVVPTPVQRRQVVEAVVVGLGQTPQCPGPGLEVGQDAVHLPGDPTHLPQHLACAGARPPGDEVRGPGDAVAFVRKGP